MRQILRAVTPVIALLLIAGQFQLSAQNADSPQPNSPQSEPVVSDEGKLSYWLLRLDNSDTVIRAEALRQVLEHPDFEYLTQEPPEQSGPGQRQFAAELARIRKDLRPFVAHLVKLMNDPDIEVRSKGIAALSALGTDAQQAVPVLLKQLQAKPVKEPVELSLIISTIYSITPRSRSATAEMWKAWQQLREPQRQALRKLLGGESEDTELFVFSVDFAATLISRKLRETNRIKIELPALMEVAKSDTAPVVVRCSILLTFELLHRDAKVLAGDIRPLAQDKSPTIRLLALQALASFEPNKSSAMKLLDSLKVSAEDRSRVNQGVDQIFRERNSVMGILNSFFSTPMFKDSVEIKGKEIILSAITDDSDPASQQEIIQLLGELGTDSRPAVPQLLKALKSDDESVREAARSALLKIDPEALEKALMKTGE